MIISEPPSAAAIYSVEAVKAPTLKRFISWVGAGVAIALSWGAWSTTPVSTRYRIIETRSGSVMAEVDDGSLDQVDLGTIIKQDLEKLEAVDFAKRWIAPNQ